MDTTNQFIRITIDLKHFHLPNTFCMVMVRGDIHGSYHNKCLANNSFIVSRVCLL